MESFEILSRENASVSSDSVSVSVEEGADPGRVGTIGGRVGDSIGGSVGNNGGRVGDSIVGRGDSRRLRRSSRLMPKAATSRSTKYLVFSCVRVTMTASRNGVKGVSCRDPCLVVSVCEKAALW